MLMNEIHGHIPVQEHLEFSELSIYPSYIVLKPPGVPGLEYVLSVYILRLHNFECISAFTLIITATL